MTEHKSPKKTNFTL